MPCDLGVLLCKKLLAEKGAYPSSVEMFVALKTTTKFASKRHNPYIILDSIRMITSTVNYATYVSAIKGFSSTRESREGRKELNRIRPIPVPVGPSLNVKVGGICSSVLPTFRYIREAINVYSLGILGRLGVSRDTRTGGWLIPYFFSGESDLVVTLRPFLDYVFPKIPRLSGCPSPSRCI